MVNIKHLLLLIILFLNSINMYSEIATIEELLKMKKQGLISEEDFKVFEAEINNEKILEKEMYDLKINSRLVSRSEERRVGKEC